MKSSPSSASSSSSSYDSLYFSATPSPSTREYTHGEEDATLMEPPSPPPAPSSSSSSFSSQPSSLDPSSSTRSEKTHDGGFIIFREEDIRMKPSSSSSSSASASSCSCSSSQPSSSNPSPSIGENTHDVFISFRGEDTRHGFVSHLHSALRRNDVRTYMDCDLERGNEISSTLLRAIEQSKISLVVFSKNYASSRWTLDELVKIMKCRKTWGQLVLPIFYRITPSEVRKTRSFSNVFNKHKNLFKSNMNETAQQWTNAMKEAADLAGWESSTYRTESELVEVIAIEVMRKLESMRQGSEGAAQISTEPEAAGPSSQNCSPDEPNSGGLHDDEHTPLDSSPTKCLSHGTINFLGFLGVKTLEVLWRKDHERLILRARRPDQTPSLDTSRSYVYRNRYVPKQQHTWWGIQQQ
ncbi:disease resistance protein LAZ5-like [Prosopis cineraria]|uniref:disease resistance protein LAZ5-like n=1 Tax=Prosopis cineraria TaxID=364024 RepID=UPI00240FDF36|nr:disease resistance protein LAZ5-like [Prosopis cineraria]